MRQHPECFKKEKLSSSSEKYVLRSPCPVSLAPRQTEMVIPPVTVAGSWTRAVRQVVWLCERSVLSLHGNQRVTWRSDGYCYPGISRAGKVKSFKSPGP